MERENEVLECNQGPLETSGQCITMNFETEEEYEDMKNIMFAGLFLKESLGTGKVEFSVSASGKGMLARIKDWEGLLFALSAEVWKLTESEVYASIGLEEAINNWEETTGEKYERSESYPCRLNLFETVVVGRDSADEEFPEGSEMTYFEALMKCKNYKLPFVIAGTEV
jgi:hypothetical protein